MMQQTANPARPGNGWTLYGFMGRSDISTLACEFVDELADRAAELRRFLAERNLPVLHSEVHQLAGAAQCYGQPHVYRAATAVERSISAGHALERIRSCTEYLVELCRGISESGNKR